VCACGRRGARPCVDARRVLGERPQRLGRDANATSRPRRGVAAHGEAVAGHGEVGAWPGLVAQVRTHACRSWLPRAAAWSSRARGTGIPGPRHDVAAKGDGGCRVQRRRDGSLHKNGTKARREGWSYGWATEGSSAALGITPAAGGQEKNGGGVAHRRG
jgi:hypothetical protein